LFLARKTKIFIAKKVIQHQKDVLFAELTEKQTAQEMTEDQEAAAAINRNIE